MAGSARLRSRVCHAHVDLGNLEVELQIYKKHGIEVKAEYAFGRQRLSQPGRQPPRRVSLLNDIWRPTYAFLRSSSSCDGHDSYPVSLKRDYNGSTRCLQGWSGRPASAQHYKTGRPVRREWRAAFRQAPFARVDSTSLVVMA
jgi:hypothetical protein